MFEALHHGSDAPSWARGSGEKPVGKAAGIATRNKGYSGVAAPPAAGGGRHSQRGGENLDDALALKRMLKNLAGAHSFFMKWSLGRSTLSSSQFSSGLKSLGIDGSRAAREVFLRCDRDGSGFVDVEELCGVIMGEDAQYGLSAQAGFTGPIDASPQRSAFQQSRGVRAGMQEHLEASSMASSHSALPLPDRRAPTPKPGMSGSWSVPYPNAPGTPGGFPVSGGFPEAPATQARRMHAGGEPSRNSMNRQKVVRLHERLPHPHTLDISSVVLEAFRKTIIHRAGAAGISALGRTFSVMDRNGDNLISPSELKLALSRFGLNMNDKDLQMLMAAVDRDNSGSITYGELLATVRGPLTKRRLALIDLAFNVLDRSGDGKVTVDDLSIYDVKHDPDVKSGKMSMDEALQHFLANFDSIDRDGVVTRREFAEYYMNVSASIENDDYFELMIRNAWHIPGGEGWSANTSNTRVLVTLTSGEQSIVCLEDDRGLDVKNHTAVIAQLKRQGVANVLNYKTCA